MIIWVLSRFSIKFRNIRWKLSRDNRPLGRVTNRIIENPRQIWQIQGSKKRQLSIHLWVLVTLGWKLCRKTSRTVCSLPIEGRPCLIRWWLDRIVTPRIMTLSLSRDLRLSSLTRTPNRISYTRIRLAYSRDSFLPPNTLKNIS
jgi:hypothetical protein